jgi:hypothetical protein
MFEALPGAVLLGFPFLAREARAEFGTRADAESAGDHRGRHRRGHPRANLERGGGRCPHWRDAGRATVTATSDGYQALVDFVGEYSMLRAWGVEGIGGHGARLARLLAKRYELVLELDRPKRARRGNGAKSDPLDATRAARKALMRAKLGTPRSTGQRQALSVLLAARRSAVQAGTDVQRPLFSLVLVAPNSSGNGSAAGSCRRCPASRRSCS